MTDFIIDLMVIIWLTILIYLFLSELYFRSRRFKAIKRKIDTYTKECNELNDHIEAMKNVDLGFVSTYNGELKCSNPNINSEYLKYNRTIYKCSYDTLDRAQKNPFKYIHKYFNVEFNEKTLERLENTLNDFLAVKEGKEKLKRQREEIIKSISSELPFIIRNFTGIQRLSRKLGFKDIDLKDYFIEFEDYDDCKFGSRCIHQNEPNCAVKEAVENGEIPKERYESYIQLLNEIRQGKRRY